MRATLYKRSSYQDRLGTNIGKAALKKRMMRLLTGGGGGEGGE
eukprot:COSAG06_NODE_72380_length_171_cov_109.541667_1_plen_42_part_01